MNKTITRKLLNLTFPIKQSFGVLYENRISKTERIYEIVDRLNHDKVIVRVLLNLTEFNAWEIVNLEIQPEYSNQGIGSNLIIKLCKNGLLIAQKRQNVNSKMWMDIKKYLTVYSYHINNGAEDFDFFHLDKAYEDADYFLVAKSFNTVKQNVIENYGRDKYNKRAFKSWQYGKQQFPVLPISFSEIGDF